MLILPPTVGGSGLKLSAGDLWVDTTGILPPTVGGSGLKLAQDQWQQALRRILPPTVGGSGLKLCPQFAGMLIVAFSRRQSAGAD